MPETKKKLILGLRIAPSLSTKPNFLKFEFEVGLGAPSKDFISNSEIREAILKARLPPDSCIGFYTIHPNASMNGAFWGSYHPFLEGNNFNGKGIAQLLEYGVLQKIKSDFPEIIRLWHHHARISAERHKHLQKRGFTDEQLFVKGYRFSFIGGF